MIYYFPRFCRVTVVLLLHMILAGVTHVAAFSRQVGWRLASSGTWDGQVSPSFPTVSVSLSFQMDFPCDFSSRVADLFTQ